MSTASRGRALEHKARHELEDNGWCVIRSAGSKGAADLIAASMQGADTRIVVQAKLTPGPISPRERRALIGIAAIFRALPIHYFKSSRGVYEWRRLTGDGPNDYTQWSPS